MTSINDNFLYAKRWALFAIIFGTLVGFASAIICIGFNLVIFGFNIMYIVSPLMAGFIENFYATRKYGRSTGAISALLTFLIINGYGWFGSGFFYPKEPVTLSIITLIAIGLTIQAAFPILVNYILFVVVVGIFIRLVSLPARMLGSPIKKEKIEVAKADEIIIEGLTEPLISVPDLKEGKIEKYIGLVTGEAVAEEKQDERLLNKVLKMIQPLELDDLDLSNARKLAVSRALENAKSLGANHVVEIMIDYVTMGGLQGGATIVTATGTAVVIKK